MLTLAVTLALMVGTVTAGATPAGVEYKDNGTAVIWGDAMAPAGTPTAALAYASDLIGG
jgi:hypothetical protein